MKNAHWLMDGLSLHYYTMPGEFWTGKGSATDFPEEEWFITLQRALHMNYADYATQCHHGSV